MADEASHRAEAIANRTFAEQLIATQSTSESAMRWAVTATFYSALHAMTAYLIARGVTVGSHDDRSTALADPRNGVPNEVFEAYQFLKRRSTDSRYYIRRFETWQVQRLLDAPLKTVTDFVGL